MMELEQSITNFLTTYNNWSPDDSFLNYHTSISCVHDLCRSIFIAEQNDVPRELILEKLKLIREIHAGSPFINRVQKWPRGYAGDFETIEYICNCANLAVPDTMEFFLEEYALKSTIAQQHRNKVTIQSKFILETITEQNNPGIMVVGCGSGRDVREIQFYVKNREFSLFFNDIDPEALEYTRSKLADEVLSKSSFIHKNIINLVRSGFLKQQKFQLVLFGGVFDYLTDRQITFILENTYNALEKNGKIIFTNILNDNPFRIWIEYLANWILKERTTEECLNLCMAAGIHTSKIDCHIDQTGLTQILEVRA